MTSTGSTQLEQVLEGLHATPPAPLPFGERLVVRSFLLERVDTNVLMYNAPGISEAAGAISDLGGASQLLLNHAHEAMFGPPELDVPVYVHERDRAEAAASLPIAGTFGAQTSFGDDLEVISTPGHTPGTTCFVWDAGSDRCLFSGDMLWVQDGQWSAVILGSSDRDSYIESLEELRELDIDVLVPWGAAEGAAAIDVVGCREARKRIDAVIARVRAGGNR
ncbi:MAG: MBL fold metallo-hydrolase [Thermoleophilaceae bacterium]|nr:MBL fold metallo-hydrolase [Thermoleophilaceae bacterium]